VEIGSAAGRTASATKLAGLPDLTGWTKESFHCTNKISRNPSTEDYPARYREGAKIAETDQETRLIQRAASRAISHALDGSRIFTARLLSRSEGGKGEFPFRVEFRRCNGSAETNLLLPPPPSPRFDGESLNSRFSAISARLSRVYLTYVKPPSERLTG
jgi:hypothetical protein